MTERQIEKNISGNQAKGRISRRAFLKFSVALSGGVTLAGSPKMVREALAQAASDAELQAGFLKNPETENAGDTYAFQCNDITNQILVEANTDPYVQVDMGWVKKAIGNNTENIEESTENGYYSDDSQPNQAYPDLWVVKAPGMTPDTLIRGLKEEMAANSDFAWRLNNNPVYINKLVGDAQQRGNKYIQNPQGAQAESSVEEAVEAPQADIQNNGGTEPQIESQPEGQFVVSGEGSEDVLATLDTSTTKKGVLKVEHGGASTNFEKFTQEASNAGLIVKNNGSKVLLICPPGCDSQKASDFAQKLGIDIKFPAPALSQPQGQPKDVITTVVDDFLGSGGEPYSGNEPIVPAVNNGTTYSTVNKSAVAIALVAVGTGLTALASGALVAIGKIYRERNKPDFGSTGFPHEFTEVGRQFIRTERERLRFEDAQQRLAEGARRRGEILADTPDGRNGSSRFTGDLGQPRRSDVAVKDVYPGTDNEHNFLRDPELRPGYGQELNPNQDGLVASREKNYKNWVMGESQISYETAQNMALAQREQAANYRERGDLETAGYFERAADALEETPWSFGTRNTGGPMHHLAYGPYDQGGTLRAYLDSLPQEERVKALDAYKKELTDSPVLTHGSNPKYQPAGRKVMGSGRYLVEHAYYDE